MSSKKINRFTEAAKERCNPYNIALKTFFLGPQAENIDQVSEVFAHILYRWAQYRRARFPNDGAAITSKDQTSLQFQQTRQNLMKNLDRLVSEFENEIPKFSPRYFGHMFSEISLPSLYASFLSLLHNPNNISHESSQVGLRIEKEAIRALLKMVGLDSHCATGHFTSCGTIANLEAVLRARSRTKSDSRFALFFPKHAHYSWEKISSILGLHENQIFWIQLDREGRMSSNDLDRQIQNSIQQKLFPAFIVSVLGTTEFGTCDPVLEISNICKNWKTKGINIWHHVDAAYGGFFTSLKNISQPDLLSKHVCQSLKAISKADSITIDPHKLGYTPYASGAFLCRSRALYRMKHAETPYLSKNDKGGELWTVEGSRSASGALSIGLMSRTLGFVPEGFGKILRLTLESRRELHQRLKKIQNIRILPSHDLNILGFVVAKKFEGTSKVSRRSISIYKKLSPENPHAPYFLTRTSLDGKRYPLLLKDFASSWKAPIDSDLQILRLCLMNPFLISNEPKVRYLDDFAETLNNLSKKI